MDSGLRLVWDGGKVALASGQDVYLIHVAAAGLLARAQGFHDGSVAAIEADNPYAAFTLLRPYAENAVALIYLRDKPAALAKFVNNPNPPGGTVVSVQRTPVAVLVATGGDRIAVTGSADRGSAGPPNALNADVSSLDTTSAIHPATGLPV